MINFGNHYIKEIHYDGHNIKKAYGCGGNLVWEKEFTGRFRAKYSDGRTHEVECDKYIFTLSSGDTRPSGYQPSAMTEAVIGQCVKYIGDDVFNHCHGLTSIIIPDNITNIWERSFYYCTGLTGITIPNSVKTIGHDAFCGCSGLTCLNLGTGLTVIGEAAFSDCKSLTSVTIPNSVTEIGPAAFEKCSGLQSITVLATTPPTSGYMPFYGTNNCPIYVPANSVDAYKTASGWSDYASRIQPIP